MFVNALRALRANSIKTALIYISMTFAVTAIFLITAISHGIITMYASMLQRDGDIIVTQAKIADTFFSDVDMALIPSIRHIDGVKKVSALIVGASPVENLPIVAIYGSSANRMQHYKLLWGHYPKHSQVIVGQALYQKLGTKKSLTIGGTKFHISGVYTSDVGFENGGVVMPLADAGTLFHKSASMLLITVDMHKKINAVIKKIGALSDTIEAKSTRSFIQHYNQFQLINNSSYAISFIAFTMGLLSIASLMTITVYARRDEFGIMRALGIAPKKITASLIVESLILGLVSFTSALSLSFATLFIIKKSSLFQGYINGEIDMTLVAMVLTATIFMSVVGALLPAYSAAKTDPIILIQRGCA